MKNFPHVPIMMAFMAVFFVFSNMSGSIDLNPPGEVLEYNADLDLYLDNCVEQVHLTGKLTSKFRLDKNPEDNQYKTNFHLTAHGVGEGLVSGKKYSYSENRAEIIHSTLINGHFNFISKSKVKLIGRGSAPNSEMIFTLHITINANGELVVVIMDASSQCS